MKKVFFVLIAILCVISARNTCSAEENAAATYNQIASGLKGEYFEDPLEPLWNSAIVEGRWSENEKKVKNLVFWNKDSLEKFKQATMLKRYDIFLGEAERYYSTDIALPSHNNEISLCRLVLLEGKLLEQEKNFAEALRSYLAALHLADQLRHPVNNTALDGIISNIVQEYTFAVVVPFVNRQDLPSDIYKELLSFLESFTIENCGLVAMLQGEYEFMDKRFLNSINKILMEKVPSTIDSARKDKILNEFSEALRSLSGEVKEYILTAARDNNPKYFTEKYTDFKKRIETELKAKNITIENLPPEQYEDFVKNNLVEDPSTVAKVAMVGNQPSWNRFITKTYSLGTRLNLLKVACAIKLYQADNKRLPNTVDELVPTYIKSVPIDDFNRPHPLSYKLKEGKAVIYSFGPDRVDDAALKICDGDECLRGEKDGDIILEVQ